MAVFCRTLSPNRFITLAVSLVTSISNLPEIKKKKINALEMLIHSQMAADLCKSYIIVIKLIGLDIKYNC